MAGHLLEHLRQQELLGEPLAGLAVIHPEQVAFELEQLEPAHVGGIEERRVLLGMGDDEGHAADVVEEAGGVGVGRAAAEAQSDLFGGRGRGDVVTPAALHGRQAQRLAEVAPQADGGGERADAGDAEQGRGVADAGHLAADAVVRRVGGAQHLGGDGRVGRDGAGDIGQRHLFLRQQAEQVHRHRRNRRQFTVSPQQARFGGRGDAADAGCEVGCVSVDFHPGPLHE